MATAPVDVKSAVIAPSIQRRVRSRPALISAPPDR
jgi:hypothetical protein